MTTQLDALHARARALLNEHDNATYSVTAKSIGCIRQWLDDASVQGNAQTMPLWGELLLMVVSNAARHPVGDDSDVHRLGQYFDAMAQLSAASWRWNGPPTASRVRSWSSSADTPFLKICGALDTWHAASWLNILTGTYQWDRSLSVDQI